MSKTSKSTEIEELTLNHSGFIACECCVLNGVYFNDGLCMSCHNLISLKQAELAIKELKKVKNEFTSPDFLGGLRKHCLNRIAELEASIEEDKNG